MTAAVMPSASSSSGPLRRLDPGAGEPSMRAGPECFGAARFPVLTGPIVTDGRGPDTPTHPPGLDPQQAADLCECRSASTTSNTFPDSLANPCHPDVRLPLHLVVTPVWFSTCSPHGATAEPTDRRRLSTVLPGISAADPQQSTPATGAFGAPGWCCTHRERRTRHALPVLPSHRHQGPRLPCL